MYKRILLLVGLITQFFSVSLMAQPAEKSASKLPNSLLWKISGKGLNQPSYLFGTIHMICNQDYFFNQTMKDALIGCEKLLLEINLSDPNTVAQYQQSMMLPAGKELKNFFKDEAEYEAFSQKLKTHIGIDASLFQNLKPLILLSLIAQKSFECENTASYEMNLLELSKEHHMSVAGLETSLAQMKILDDMKDEEIKKILLEGIEDIEKDNKMQDQMVLAYKNQQIEQLHDIILSSKEFQHQEDALINNRNKDWVEKLPVLMKESSCFVAVGAGHLAGKQGVIQLLRDKGYEVVAVNN